MFTTYGCRPPTLISTDFSLSNLPNNRCLRGPVEKIGPGETMPSPDEKVPSPECLRTKLAVIVDEWRKMPTPTNEHVARWANRVSDLNIRIAATEVLAEQYTPAPGRQARRSLGYPPH